MSQRNGLTVIELLVSLAVISLLVSILLPAISRSRAMAQKIRCVNNLRNLAFGLTQYDHLHERLPASGYYLDPPHEPSRPHHSWAVEILPWIDQGNLHEQWEFDETYLSANNLPLSRFSIEVFQCPVDLTLSGGRGGDLSYVVNGGIGFTFRTQDGVGDCVQDWRGERLDLNGDGSACSGTAADDEDRQLFKRLGLFFAENWKVGGTSRNHSLADVVDGTSQTFLATENVRTGYDPSDSTKSFANPHPRSTAFYIGSPCLYGNCRSGSVDYARSQLGNNRINSGLNAPEGRSSVPNSYHPGGVHFAFADGHVSFLSEAIDGSVYAALASPQGTLLSETALQQAIVSGESF